MEDNTLRYKPVLIVTEDGEEIKIPRSMVEYIKIAKKLPELKIVVTQKVIDTAIAKHSGACIFADAIEETYPKFTRARVNSIFTKISDPEKGFRYTYITPPEAVKIIADLDAGRREEIKPCEIILRREGGHIKYMENASQKELEQKRESARKRKLIKEQQTVFDNHGSETSEPLPILVGGEEKEEDETNGIPPSYLRIFGREDLAKTWGLKKKMEKEVA